jgi:hypothetical protein
MNKNLQMSNRDKETAEYWNRYDEAIEKEQEAVKALRQFAEENKELLKFIWGWGDGFGGYILDEIRATIQADAINYPSSKNTYKKIPIPAILREEVFIRDDFRCVKCGSRKKLCADHIYPEALGGEATFENLQTLCKSCNSKKGKKVDK